MKIKVTFLLLFIIILISNNCYAAKEKINLETDKRIEITVDSEDYGYTGKEIIPKVIVKFDGKFLKYNKDYIIELENNKDIGTGTVKIIGKGNKTGVVKKEFPIELKTVTAIKTSAKNTDALMLIWEKPNCSVSGYEVYMSKTKDGKFKLDNTVHKESYVKTGLSKGKTYYFKIRTYSMIKNNKVYSEFSEVFQSSTLPKTPKISRVKIAKEEAELKWWKDKNATGYEVYMSSSEEEDFQKIMTLGKNNMNSYIKKDLKSGETYYFKIRTYKNVGMETLYSEYSPIKTVTIK